LAKSERYKLRYDAAKQQVLHHVQRDRTRGVASAAQPLD
jgi:hypothetical protein